MKRLALVVLVLVTACIASSSVSGARTSTVVGCSVLRPAEVSRVLHVAVRQSQDSGGCLFASARIAVGVHPFPGSRYSELFRGFRTRTIKLSGQEVRNTRITLNAARVLGFAGVSAFEVDQLNVFGPGNTAQTRYLIALRHGTVIELYSSQEPRDSHVASFAQLEALMRLAIARV